MTHLTTVTGSFHAKVVAARLGAEGIPAQVRGGVDGLYPIFADIRIYVRADQLDAAREILLGDAVDAVFVDAVERRQDETTDHRDRRRRSSPPGDETGSAPRRRLPVHRDGRLGLVLAAATLALVVVLVVVGTIAAGSRF